MSLEGVDTSHLSSNMVQSLKYLDENMDHGLSEDTKKFLNGFEGMLKNLQEQHPNFDWQKFYENYYGNLAKTLQNVKHMEQVTEQAAQKRDCSQSSFEGKPQAHAGLKLVVNGNSRATAVGGGVLLPADTVTVEDGETPIQRRQEALKGAAGFGLVHVLKCPK